MAFNPVREKHMSDINILQNEFPEWIYLPIAQQHPDLPLLRLNNKSRELPAAEPIVQSGDFAPSSHYRFWTDGACSNPTNKDARLSTWAVVVDSTTSSFERENLVQSITSIDASPDVLQCHMLGNTPGEQSAARAELCAVIQAGASAQTTNPDATSDIFTDASYVISTVEALERVNSIEKPIKLPTRI